ncbi:TRAP transporter small permease subunit [Kaustia mangrovi]|uniref:TRAP transporter small permease protein n=1 Tax=Kaustia mangrovi TaxID=2593653 RepID=A0A7S8HCY1_9HYPH|nr:TRAP transporter small permease subunit [Kaustia mangrovi]QPC44116.1 TRAP transporter small permease subunit [Kaustia mangrovi]
MTRLLDAVDGISGIAGAIAMAMLAVLVGSMIFEVVARYVFGAPTIWAFDISYMLNGSIFLMGAAYALKADAHVRIDFLSSRLPERVQRIVNAAVYALVLAPVFAIFSYIGIEKTVKAYRTAEVEMVSPWAPLMWPFYAALAAGLLVMTLQLLAEAARFALGHKSPGSTEHELEDTEAL